MADAATKAITQGALNAIFNDPERHQRDFPVPVCQCVQIKPLGPQGDGNSDRYRVVLSDMQNFVQSMLATQANHVIHDGKLKKGSIVRLKQFQANAVKGRKILIILSLEVIENLGEPEKLGEPTALTVKEEEDMMPTNTTISGNGFYGSRPQQPPAQDRALPTRAGPTNSAPHGTIYPIEGLSPYASKWTIKARVTSKSEIKTWHKTNSEGKLFSVNLLDESGEIKATGFNEQCDMLYDLLQEGSVYYISTCRVQLAKKQFSNLPNDYELTFERDTQVEKAEDADNVPQVRFNFTEIADLQTVEKDSTIDILGAIKEVGDLDQITSKTTQKPYDKRDLTLVDESGYSVKLTIWGKAAANFNEMKGTIVAFKGAKVSDFGGRSLSLLSSGSMIVSPDITESHSLKAWYELDGRTESFKTHSDMAGVGAAGGRTDQTVTVAQVKDDNLGTNEKPDYFTLTATIIFVKNKNFSYPACLSEGCNKKVTEVGDGTWRCERCNMSHPRPEHRYILSVNVADHTGQLWLSCFDDVARSIMGMSADQLVALEEANEHMKVFENALSKTLTFKCRAKTEMYQDQANIRYQVTGAAPINYVAEAHKLAELIQSYSLD